MADKRREEEDLEPFFQLERAQVLSEARCFSDVPLDARQCCSVVTELLCLLSQGERLTADESVALFFGVTKLFQSEDPQLRRLVYLVIKELKQDTDQAFIVISSLEKDINSAVEMFKANAIRVHSKVIDASMLEQRARLFSQALVSSNDHIASAALTAGVRLFPANPEVVRRWVSEVRESVSRPAQGSSMVCFHALHLLYKINEHDWRATVRMISTLVKGGSSLPSDSALARCLLVRYVFGVVASKQGRQGLDESARSRLTGFLRQCVKHFKSPAVMFEAAKALCHLPGVSETEVSLALNVLQEFLNSPRPVLRFASVRALSAIVRRFPKALSPSCAVDLEQLIGDSNRSIATLAISTLLETAAEFSIERLLSSIGDFMGEISDELKQGLLSSIRQVCSRFPQKYEALLGFLNAGLRDDGGESFKNSVVDCMLLLMDGESDFARRARELGLEYLCEYIEDCEYARLSVRIITLIGKLAPQTVKPKRYVRFIFNRVLLELSCVRAAAVTCLSQFALAEPLLERDIEILLKRSLTDDCDEVRDRALAFSTMLAYCARDSDRQAEKEQRLREQRDDAVAGLYDDDETGELLDYDDAKGEGSGDSKMASAASSAARGGAASESDGTTGVEMTSALGPLRDGVTVGEVAGMVAVPPVEFDLQSLELSLMNYLSTNDSLAQKGDGSAFDKEFATEDIERFSGLSSAAGGAGDGSGDGSEETGVDDEKISGVTRQADAYGAESAADTAQRESEEALYEEVLRSAKESLPELGSELKRCVSEALTEPESEYQVSVVKRVYRDYIVVQCTVSSAMEDQLLSEVFVELDEYEDSEVTIVECPSQLAFGDSGTCLLIISRSELDSGDDDSSTLLFGSYDAVLKFVVKEAGETAQFEEGYPDSYQLMPLEFGHRDWLISKPELSKVEFKELWKRLEGGPTVQKQGSLSSKNGDFQSVVTSALERIGLSAVEDCQWVSEGVSTHVCNLVAKLVTGQPCLMRVAFQIDDSGRQVSYKARCECPSERFCHLTLDKL